MDEQSREKYVTLSFIAAGLIVAYIVSELIYLTSGQFDLEASIRNFGWISRGVTVGSGLVCFFALRTLDASNQYMHEVVAELARVTWPSLFETRAATIVVMILTIVAGIGLGFIDAFWTYVLKAVYTNLPRALDFLM